MRSSASVPPRLNVVDEISLLNEALVRLKTTVSPVLENASISSKELYDCSVPTLLHTPHSAIDQPISPKTTFTSLPRELRDQVYDYWLQDFPFSSVEIGWSNFLQRFTYLRYRRTIPRGAISATKQLTITPFLQANQQINVEAAEMLLKRTEFRFTSGVTDALSYLSMLRPCIRNLIRNVEIFEVEEMAFQPMAQRMSQQLRHQSFTWLSFCELSEEHLRLDTLTLYPRCSHLGAASLARRIHAVKILLAAACCRELKLIEFIKPRMVRKPKKLLQLKRDRELVRMAKTVAYESRWNLPRWFKGGAKQKINTLVFRL